MNQHPAPPIAPLRDPDNEPTVPQFPAPGWHSVREELRAICAQAPLPSPHRVPSIPRHSPS